MGIQKFRDAFGTVDVSFTREELQKFWKDKHVSIGIDLSIWVHGLLKVNAISILVKAAYYKVIDLIFARVCFLLECGASEVFLVMDGKTPVQKAETSGARRKKAEDARVRLQELFLGEECLTPTQKEESIKLAKLTVRPNKQLMDAIQKRIQFDHVHFIQAPYESDAQLAKMLRIGHINLVATKDQDLFVHGCDCLLWMFKHMKSAMPNVVVRFLHECPLFPPIPPREIKLNKEGSPVVEWKFPFSPFNWNKATRFQQYPVANSIYDTSVYTRACFVSLLGCDYWSGPKGLGYKTLAKMWLESGGNIMILFEKVNKKFNVPNIHDWIRWSVGGFMLQGVVDIATMQREICYESSPILVDNVSTFVSIASPKLNCDPVLDLGAAQIETLSQFHLLAIPTDIPDSKVSTTFLPVAHLHTLRKFLLRYGVRGAEELDFSKCITCAREICRSKPGVLAPIDPSGGDHERARARLLADIGVVPKQLVYWAYFFPTPDSSELHCFRNKDFGDRVPLPLVKYWLQVFSQLLTPPDFANSDECEWWQEIAPGARRLVTSEYMRKTLVVARPGCSGQERFLRRAGKHSVAFWTNSIYSMDFALVNSPFDADEVLLYVKTDIHPSMRTDRIHSTELWLSAFEGIVSSRCHPCEIGGVMCSHAGSILLQLQMYGLYRGGISECLISGILCRDPPRGQVLAAVEIILERILHLNAVERADFIRTGTEKIRQCFIPPPLPKGQYLKHKSIMEIYVFSSEKLVSLALKGNKNYMLIEEGDSDDTFYVTVPAPPPIPDHLNVKKFNPFPARFNHRILDYNLVHEIFSKRGLTFNCHAGIMDSIHFIIIIIV